MSRAVGALLALLLTACGSSDKTSSAGDGGSSGTANAAGSAGKAPDVPFERPPYEPQPGSCGFDAPAFCDTFEDGPKAGGRSGELDPAFWSVVRGVPGSSANFDDAIRIGPALIGKCRADLSDTRVLPDSDVLVCDPVPSIPSRHALGTAAAQNYGLSTYRIRQQQPWRYGGRSRAWLISKVRPCWRSMSCSASSSALARRRSYGSQRCGRGRTRSAITI